MSSPPSSSSSPVSTQPSLEPLWPPRITSIGATSNMTEQQQDVTHFSQSTPTLVARFDETNLNAEYHTGRRHSQGGIHGGQTWIEFISDSGATSNVTADRSPRPNALPPAPPDRHPHPSAPRYQHALPARPSPHSEASSRSSERKRRLTTAESPMRRPSSIRMHSNAGESSSNPINASSSPVAPSPQPPLPPLPPQSVRRSSVRRESDLVLPPWQPDSDVTHCPVCHSQFTFFYRKHHCRKCGRVVCAACSPHRITIPRQFIVHPPSDTTANFADLTGDDDANTMSSFGPFRNPALGGGEEVRVCNPCVPDPNYSPPPQYTPPFHPAHYSSSMRRPFATSSQSRHRSTQSVHDASQAIGHGQRPRSRDPFSDRRTSYYNSTRVADLWPPPTQPQQHVHAHPSHSQQYDHLTSPHSRHNPHLTSPHGHPPGADSGNYAGPNMFRRSFFAPVNTHMQQPVQVIQQPAPRRQIAEEDECPICGNELPPKGPDGDESDRIQHVEDCIALHSSSPTPVPANQTSTSLPSQRTRGMSTAGNGEGASNRLSHAARGMFPYVATEKDCVDEDGTESECVICFEEFEAGDRMARLVCWCKFHEACIKQWWDKKGRGACPTHQLHD